MNNKKVFCFGELLLRFSPQLQGKWIQENKMPVFIGGAELNVARALANWGLSVGYCSALPDNYLSKEIIETLQLEKIATKAIKLHGERIGAYILPMGADLKNAGVIYDRAGSSFSNLVLGMMDWKQLLKDYEWFHFSAISPALNQNIADVCAEALQVAQEMGLKISVDLNYRSKLWQYGKNPKEIMPDLVQYAHIIMGNIWSAHQLLGTNLALDSDQVVDQKTYLSLAQKVAEEIFDKYPSATKVANTFRFGDNDFIDYYATSCSRNEMVVSKNFQIHSVVDKVGSGDCFMAGLIFSELNGYTKQDQINFSASAAIGKLQEFGDSTQQEVENIKSRF